ncbi:IS607 family transposase [Acidilobus sp. 7A]|uniref:IS607 family transposase n=1 Tax=Acidilobus sp. 7A TaxID=1577685 RepID=UPI000764EC42|nr:IS607 family transposase [Acidilobus sp. 7A]AMD31279.1 transposase [Acidilobus sp. 7A]
MRPKEVCERLGISYTTLRDYVKRGYIKPVLTPGGKWRFREEDVERLIGVVVKQRRVVLYARASSNSQRDDLEGQVKVLEDWARQNNIVDYEVVTDIGSGLDEDRRGFEKLLTLAVERKISKIVIAYPDRLTRFGFKTIEELLRPFGVEIVVLSHEDKDPREELVEDLITVISHFAGKLYGMRSHKYEKVVEGVRKLLEDP